MVFVRIVVLLLIAMFHTNTWAQEGVGSLISPGDLSTAHKKYDGITNCTKCHEMGKGVPDSKCLDCHDKLAERIKNKQGLHAKYTDPCISCHDDHKGRSFKMISFGKDKFKHDDTGYPLKAKHGDVKCIKCHKKEGVYTGLLDQPAAAAVAAGGEDGLTRGDAGGDIGDAVGRMVPAPAELEEAWQSHHGKVPSGSVSFLIPKDAVRGTRPLAFGNDLVHRQGACDAIVVGPSRTSSWLASQIQHQQDSHEQHHASYRHSKVERSRLG